MQTLYKPRLPCTKFHVHAHIHDWATAWHDLLHASRPLRCNCCVQCCSHAGRWVWSTVSQLFTTLGYVHRRQESVISERADYILSTMVDCRGQIFNVHSLRQSSIDESSLIFWRYPISFFKTCTNIKSSDIGPIRNRLVKQTVHADRLRQVHSYIALAARRAGKNRNNTASDVKGAV